MSGPRRERPKIGFGDAQTTRKRVSARGARSGPGRLDVTDSTVRAPGSADWKVHINRQPAGKWALLVAGGRIPLEVGCARLDAAPLSEY